MSNKAKKNNNKFQNLVLSVLLIILVGGLLKVGKGIALPILAAIIWVYIITSAANMLGHWPVLKHLPLFFRRAIIFIIFISGLVGFSSVVIVTIEQIIAVAPTYQQNIEIIIKQIAASLGIENQPDLQTLIDATLGQFKLQKMLSGLLVSLGSISGTISLVLIYAAFLMAERNAFSVKLIAAMPSKYEVERTQTIMHDINSKIGDYLAAKTLINIILATISYAIMWAFGVDFALFWALLIGLLNYIPYIGSLFAVLFPVILTLAQFASLEWTLFVASSLILVQWLVGNVLEPRMIGKQVNLSPFVVIVSLSIWFALLGIGGAILAIPLTSMFAIILAAFKPSKPFAILLAQDIEAVSIHSVPDEEVN